MENVTGYLVTISELPDVQIETGNFSEAVDSSMLQTGDMSLSSCQDEDTKPVSKTFQQSMEEPKVTFDALKAGTKYYITVASVYQDDNKRVVPKPADTATLETNIPEVEEVSDLVVTVLDDTALKITWNPYEETQTGADGTTAEVTCSLYTLETENGGYKVLADPLTETTYT